MLNNRLLFYIFRFALFNVNMETRQFKQKFLHGDHTFNAAKKFSSGKLPTYKEVIERVLCKNNWTKKQTSALIAQELARSLVVVQRLSILSMWLQFKKKYLQFKKIL